MSGHIRSWWTGLDRPPSEPAPKLPCMLHTVRKSQNSTQSYLSVTTALLCTCSPTNHTNSYAGLSGVVGWRWLHASNQHPQHPCAILVTVLLLQQRITHLSMSFDSTWASSPCQTRLPHPTPAYILVEGTKLELGWMLKFGFEYLFYIFDEYSNSIRNIREWWPNFAMAYIRMY